MECPERAPVRHAVPSRGASHTEFGRPDARATSCSTSAALSRTGPWTSIIDDSVDGRLPRARWATTASSWPCRAAWTPPWWRRWCARAIGKQLTCVFVNHGLLRKGEPEQVEDVFTKQFDVDFIHVHAEERYAEAARRRHRPGAEAPHHRHAVLGGVLRRGPGSSGRRR